MRIDAHQHFWRYDPDEFAWITDAMEGLKQDYLPEDLQPLLGRAGIQKTVAVQARQQQHETDWLLELAGIHSFIAGVVGWLDLRSPQVHDQLVHYARHPKFSGVRHIVHDEPDDRFMLQAEFLRGLSMLAELKLTYDLLLFPKHLPVAVEVVRQFPRQRFVVDHIAKPSIKTQSKFPWEADIRALARYENVACKISGMATEAVWMQWKLEDFAYYLDTVFDCFGVERLMFGSDWPVCTLAGTYAEVVLIVQEYARRLPVDAQDKIFGGNAAEFYGLL